MSSGDVPQGVVTGVVITVTAAWALSMVVQLLGLREIDPGINGIMGAVIAFLGIAFGKSRRARNTIRAEDAGANDDD